MKYVAPPPASADDEISRLTALLQKTGQRLEELTGGEVDSVVDRTGRVFLLKGVQAQLRHAEDSRQATILNALPAHIALLDVRGVIISVNEAWRQFADANVLQGPGHAVGRNYLEICDGARGDDSAEARQAAEGIRSVLDRREENFSMEYPCHSPAQQRWFLMTVSPLADDRKSGAVVMHLNITERKRSEEEQRATQQLLDNIVENIPTAVQLKSVQDDLRLLKWNKAAESMYGLPRDEAIGRNVHDLWPEADADRMHAADLDLLVTGKTQDFPDRLAKTKNRGDIRVHMRKVALFDAGGKATHLLVVADDMTSQLADQARLRQSEARFRSLTMLSSDWFWEQDEQHRFARFSGGEGVEGWGPDQNKAVGMHRWDLGGVVPISCSWEEHKEVLDAHQPFRNFEYSRILGDGRLQFVEASGEPIFDASGAFTGYRGVATEITGRKNAEKDLERQQSELRTLFDLMPAMIWFKDTQNRILRVNSRAASVAGKAVAEIEGKPSSEIYPQDFARFYADDQAVMASGKPRLGYVEALHGPNGEEQWVQTDKVPYFDHGGQVIGIVVMAQDVTERKHAEQDLKRFRAAMDSSGDAIVLVDRTSMRYVDVNQTLCGLVGYTRQEVIGMTPMDLFGMERDALERDYDAIIADENNKALMVEGHYRHKDGSLIPIETRRRAMRTDAGWIIVGSARDITDRRISDDKIRQLNRMYVMLSGINALIVRAHSRDDLFRDACRIAVEKGGFHSAWIGVVDIGAQRIVPAALAGADEGLFASVRSLFSSSAGALPGNTLAAQAVRQKRAFVSSDSQNDPAVVLGKSHAEFNVRSMAMVPLIMGDQAIAVLALYASEIDFFHAEEITLLTELAGDIAFAMEQIEKAGKLARITRVNAMLSGINGAIVRCAQPDELFREVCRIAVSEGGFSVARAFERGLNGKVRIAASTDPALGVSQRIVDDFNADPAHCQNLLALGLRAGKPLVSNDVANDARMPNRAALTEGGTFALAVLPIAVDKRIAGALILHAREPGMFDAAELRLLLEVVSNVSFALDHMEKEAKVRRLTRVYAVLSGINSLIVHARDRNELFTSACRIAVEQGNFVMAWIGIVDRTAMELLPVASAGTTNDYRALVNQRFSLLEDAPRGNSLGARAIREKTVVFSNDVQGDPGVVFKDEHAVRGSRSMVILPLEAGGRAEGLLTLYAGETDFFDEEEIRLLTELAGDIAFAVDNIDRAEKLDRVTRVNAMLSGINGAIVRIRDRQALFEEACRIAFAAGGMSFAWIGMADASGGQLRLVASAGRDEGFLQTIRDRLALGAAAPEAEGLGTRALREGRVVVVNDVAADPVTSRRKAFADRGIKAVAIFPLFIAGQAVGTFALHSEQAGFFDDDELRLLNEVAANIAFALEHIEKEEKVRRLTRVYAVLSGINTLIVRTLDRDELFREACRIAVEIGGFAKAWVGTVDRATKKFTMVAAHGGDPLFFRSLEKEVAGKVQEGLGLVMRAIDTGQPVIVNDAAIDPDVLLKDSVTSSGVRSLAILPLAVSGEVVAVFSLNADVVDYFDDEEMKLLLELAGDIAFAIDHLAKQERIDYLAYYDVLTGLANRRLFLERVAQYMRGAAAGGYKMAVFLIDLERFKNINDSLGRLAGDALLKQVAEWLKRYAGDASLLARVGADHFAVVLPEIRPDGSVTRLLEKTMAIFLEHPFQLGGAMLRVAVKAGGALFPDDGANADDVLRNAEVALKIAKKRGERYLFYRQEMNASAAGNLTLENQLRQALENSEFVLHYQPKINLENGKLTSCEALIRWNDPRTGLVPPGRFIPILEETGLIYDVGRWALRQAIADYLRWRAAGLPAVRIAVNVSPLQLRNHGFIEEIRQVVGVDAAAAAGLELEITESLIMEDVTHSIASLQAIRAMGVTVAIDDFGTGFSSLSYLAKLPVDTLKIDRSFVIDMTAGPSGLALVSTIVNLAHSLQLKVVAEGVETEEQSRLLRLLRCNEMQGFLFSKPVPGEIFEAKFLVPGV